MQGKDLPYGHSTGRRRPLTACEAFPRFDGMFFSWKRQTAYRGLILIFSVRFATFALGLVF